MIGFAVFVRCYRLLSSVTSPLLGTVSSLIEQICRCRDSARGIVRSLNSVHETLWCGCLRESCRNVLVLQVCRVHSCIWHCPTPASRRPGRAHETQREVATSGAHWHVGRGDAGAARPCAAASLLNIPLALGLQNSPRTNIPNLSCIVVSPKTMTNIITIRPSG